MGVSLYVRYVFPGVLLNCIAGGILAGEKWNGQERNRGMKYLNEIVCGDCLQIMKEIPGESVDLIVTDPPYGVSYRKNTNEPYMIGDSFNLFPYFLPEFYRILKKDGAVYCFSSTTKLIDILPQFCSYFKLHSIVIWDKKVGIYPRSKRHYKLRYEPILYGSKGLHKLREIKDDIIQCGTVRGKKRIHPTQKPQEVLEYLIKSSGKEGAVVLDPFVGAGTTCLAAKTLGLKYIGIEINPEYVEIAKARVSAVEKGLFK